MSNRCRRRARVRSGLWLSLLPLGAVYAQQPAPAQQPPAASVPPPGAPLPPPQGQAAAQGTGRVLQLSIEDALGIALRNNFDLEIERLATEVARYDAIGSWGAFDPVFNLQGSASKSETEAASSLQGTEEKDLRVDSSLNWPLITGGDLDLSYGHVNSETDAPFAIFDISTTDVLTAALTQPLLRGAWKRYATIEQTLREIEYQRQLEVERETVARTLLDVYNAYWDVVSSQDQLSVREIAVELGRQQLAQDQRRLEVGAGTEVDVLQSETNVAQQEELRLRADYTLRQARDTLRRMLAPRPEEEQGYEEYLDAWDWPIETLTELPEGAEAPPLDWRASLQSAIERRPELAQRRLDIEISETELARARSLRLPALDLGLRTSSAGFDPDPQDAFDKALGWEFPSSSASLTFSMPIGNRTARYAERAARASLRRSMLLYDSFELDLLAEVRTTVNEVDKQREAVAAAIKSRTLAQRQLEAEETRQQVGLSTTFQVLQFQEDLAQALSTEVLAKASYAKALASLGFVEGRLDADERAGEESER